MQFKQATDYAFRAVLNLALVTPGTVIKAQVLADEEAIPPRFLMKIMRSLIQAGLVASFRGVDGGFILAKAPEEITLLDVVNAMEGPLEIQRCLGDRELCNKHCSVACPVHSVLDLLQQQFTRGLQEATFATLVEKMDRKRGLSNLF